MTEQWRDIKGYEGLYQVSNRGRVKSMARISPQNHVLSERIRKPETDKNGYKIVNLCKEGKVKLHKVHRLVGEAFIDNPDNKPQINHIDGDKSNNDVSNLEWVSGSENVIHAFSTGLKHARPLSYYGETNPRCKLTDEQCAEMRKIKAETQCSNNALARLYNIGKTQVGRIIRNEQRMKGSVCVG